MRFPHSQEEKYQPQSMLARIRTTMAGKQLIVFDITTTFSTCSKREPGISKGTKNSQ